MSSDVIAGGRARGGAIPWSGPATRYLPLLAIAAAWEVVSLSGVLPAGALPPVHLVIVRALEFLLTGRILPDLARSLERAALGFAMAVSIGVLLGIAMERSSVARGLAKPILALTNPIPKPAFYPLFLIWLGTGNWSTIGVIFTGCVIPIVITTFNGAKRVNPHVIWMARNLGMAGPKLIFRIMIPAALPEILLGIRIGLTLSWVMLVSAEMLAGSDGLGFLISYVGEAGDYQGMFAVVMIISLIGFVADRAFCGVMGRVLRPYRE